MIYLDNASTTQLGENLVDIIFEYGVNKFFNASAIYREGVSVANDIDSARLSILRALSASENDNIVFTGSATEANNLAFGGFIKSNCKQIVVSEGEHPSVYQTALALKSKGFDVVFAPLSSSGEIDYDALENILNNKETSFISIMWASNETGAINNFEKIAFLKEKYCPQALLHCDAVQAFGKLEISVSQYGIDLLTISGHKIHGPKGIGALYFRKGLNPKPIIFGGGQEKGIRSGTENVPYIMSLKKLCDGFEITENLSKVTTLKEKFLAELSGVDFQCNSPVNASPYVLSLSFNGVNGETLVHMLEEKGILISRGSACSSKKSGNRVLQAMGVKNILGSVRISFSKNTTSDEVVAGAKALKHCYSTLISTLKGKKI